MPAVVREVVSIGLFVLLIGSTLGAVLNLARAEQLPRSETARRVMEHERENEPALGHSSVRFASPSSASSSPSAASFAA
jgi:hypothetical protein